jgi:hypothetical protein
MEGRIWGEAWRIGISEVEGCQTDRLLVLLVLHTLVLHLSFLVVQSERRDGTMTSDAESVCCVSGEGKDMEVAAVLVTNNINFLWKEE